MGGGITNQITTLTNQTETILKELVRNRNQIQMAYDGISLLVDVLDCYNISDFFQPFPNEAALVKRATDQAPGQPLFLSSKFMFKRLFIDCIAQFNYIVIFHYFASQIQDYALSFLFLGIVFLNFDAKDGSFPKKGEYKLRLNPDFTPSTSLIRGR